MLKSKPFISTKTLNPLELRQMPTGSLGREYIDFMDGHSFSADERYHQLKLFGLVEVIWLVRILINNNHEHRSLVRFLIDPEKAYVMTRYRQIHDFWHVLTKLPTSVVGEVALKVFEFQVTVCVIYL